MTPPTFEKLLDAFEQAIRLDRHAGDVENRRETVLAYVRHLERLSNRSISHMNFITNR